MIIAYCWASGRIELASHRDSQPDGTIAFVWNDVGAYAHLSDQELILLVQVKARHGKGSGQGKLFVPGVPEASGKDRAIRALTEWQDWAFPRMNGQMEN